MPPWLKLDISDLPTLLAGFSLGPVSGVVVNAIKVLLFFFFKNSGTGGVGELANFIMGLCLVLPAALIYRRKKTRKRALVGTLVGVVAMTVASGLLNYYMLIPAYSLIMPMEAILEACTAINPAMNSVLAYVLMAAMPFTLAKAFLMGFFYSCYISDYRRCSTADETEVHMSDMEKLTNSPEETKATLPEASRGNAARGRGDLPGG